MTKLEKQVIGYTATCHGLVHVLELTYGALLVSISQEFSATIFIMGVLANVMGFAFGATALPTGFIADRRSERNLLIFCSLGMGVSALIIGFSASIYLLGVGLFLLGMALGIYHPTSAAFIARVVTRRGLGFGLQGIGGNLGLALGPVLASTIAAFLGWRAAYLIFAIPPLLLALLLWLTLHPEPVPTGPAVTPVRKEKVAWHAVTLPIVLIFSITILSGFVYRALVTFLPLYLSERIQLSFLGGVLIGGSFASIVLMFGIGGQFLGGFFSERRSRESLAFLVLVLQIPLLVIMGNASGIILMSAGALFALFHFMSQPVNNILLADYSPAAWRGRIFGVYFFCNYGVGSFSASMLGYVAKQYGVNWVFVVSAGFAALALLCIIYLWTQAKKIKQRMSVAGIQTT
jgi:predicted MFS family arabinose efflux permease